MLEVDEVWDELDERKMIENNYVPIDSDHLVPTKTV